MQVEKLTADLNRTKEELEICQEQIQGSRTEKVEQSMDLTNIRSENEKLKEQL